MEQYSLSLQKTLLAWYDVNRRSLPWRQAIPDPYFVYLSEIMLQQTTVTTVQPYFLSFIEKWPTLEHLAKASLDEILKAWQGLGYYSRARNLYKTVSLLHGYAAFPSTPQDLIRLPGIGPYTADSIAAIAFDYPVLPADGNITRVFSRLLALETPLFKIEVIKKKVDFEGGKRAGDYAQAFMDLSAAVCRPKNPRCEICCLESFCQARQQGKEKKIPVISPSSPKPTRYGAVFILMNEKKEWLLERRPEKGLLGGLFGFPSSPWGTEKLSDPLTYAPYENVVWKEQEKKVRHTFTHFHLDLSVFTGTTISPKQKPPYIWASCLNKYAFPTLMKKASQVFSPSPQGHLL